MAVHLNCHNRLSCRNSQLICHAHHSSHIGSTCHNHQNCYLKTVTSITKLSQLSQMSHASQRHGCQNHLIHHSHFSVITVTIVTAITTIQLSSLKTVTVVSNLTHITTATALSTVTHLICTIQYTCYNLHIHNCYSYLNCHNHTTVTSVIVIKSVIANTWADCSIRVYRS